VLVLHGKTLDLAKIFLTLSLIKKGLFEPFFYDKYIMNTKFYNPTVITQEPTPTELEGIGESIEWDINGAIYENNYASSTKPLYTISGLWMEKFLSKTHRLYCTNLNIPLDTRSVVGIEFLLDMHRASRIEDLMIQLTLNGELIGDNKASPVDPVQSNMYTGDNSPLLPIIGNYNIYGSPADLWGTTDLTTIDVSDPTFGIVISFRSNQVYPHRDIVFVNQIGVGITYG
jgi:hypothetical protein